MRREYEGVKTAESMVSVVDVRGEGPTMVAKIRSRYFEISSVGAIQAETMGRQER